MIAASNRWQSEIRKPADGTQPGVGGSHGTTVTANAIADTMGAYVDIVQAADWSGFTGDAFEIEININSNSGSAASNRALVTIGIDTGGGYVDLIEYLSACKASFWLTTGIGLQYRFPLRIPNGAKVGAKMQHEVGGSTCHVVINLFGNPSHSALVRAGTFVRTFGATTASSDGTPVTGGGASEGAWTQIGSAMADDLWFWDVGYCNSDTAIGNIVKHIDVATGDAGTKNVVLTNAFFTSGSVETHAKASFGAVRDRPSGDLVYARAQVGSGEAGDSIIVYAVGGNYQLPGLYTVAGTVTIDGSPAANGENVLIFALDSDFISEFVALLTIAGGAGGFTTEVPDDSRTYFALYDDGTVVGCSPGGTPDVDDFDITIVTSGGGGITPPRVGSPFIR